MGKVLKVMAGDTVNIQVSSWWNSTNTPSSGPSPLTDLIAAMSGGIGAVSTKASVGQLSGSGAFSSNIGNFLSSQSGYTTSKPKAFVNWILFDEQFNYVAASSGFDQVVASNTFHTHTLNGKTMSKNGYLYIYVSNETQNIDVFFDNLQVTHIHGPVLEESNYYPFGLQMAGISSKALNFGKENKYRFNGGTELNEDLGIQLYETAFRGYDPQLGRFWQIDPLAGLNENWSPYAYAQNNPYLYNDPLGLDTLRSPTQPNWGGGDIGRVWGKDDGSIISYYQYNGWDYYSTEYPGFTLIGHDQILPPTIVSPDNGSGSNNYWWLPGFWSVSWPQSVQPPTQDGGGGTLDYATNIFGHIEFNYNLAIEGYPKVPVAAKGLSAGLSAVSTGLTGYQVYKQFKQGGIKNVSPVDATNATAGSVSLLAKFISWLGLGGKAAPAVGDAAGFIGIGVSIYQSWENVYKPMNDLNFAPDYIDPSSGQPVYVDPDQWR